MAQRTRTVEFAFETLLSNLATNTTLGTATRHDFAAVTLYLPETTGTRTIRSVLVQVTAVDVNTSSLRLDGVRIGIKLDAVAFDDQDQTGTGIASTGANWSQIFTRDVTSYFVANFGSGASQTCQVGVAFAQSSAGNLAGITAKVIITYEYDDSNTTFAKTVRIPLESLTTTLTTTLQEIGTNQVPALDTFLPETSKVYRRIWFEVFGNQGHVVGGADHQLAIALDAEAESARTLLEAFQGTSAWYYDLWIRDDLDTASVHAFKARDALVNTRWPALGVVLCVTYEYAASSTTLMNSLMLPATLWPGTLPTEAEGEIVREVALQVFEPATITLRQSALVYFFHADAGSTIGLACGSQTPYRTYVGVGATAACGPCSGVHRIDSGSGSGAGIALARGEVTLTVHARNGTVILCDGITAYVLLNYTSGKATAGEGAHAHTTVWSLLPTINNAMSGALVINRATTNQRTPIVPEAGYALAANVGYRATGWGRYGGNTSNFLGQVGLGAERISGEGPGSGWHDVGTFSARGDDDTGQNIFYPDVEVFQRNVDDPNDNALGVEAAREYRMQAGFFYRYGLEMYLTYHAHSVAVSGTVTGYTGDGSGILVEVFETVSKRKVAEATTAIGGGYSATVYDDTKSYFCVARQDATHVGRSDDGPPP